MNVNPKISVVIPCYNEAANLPYLVKAINPILETIGNYEVWFVDDGSADTTFDEINKIHNKNINFKAISLSQNFGHQIALMAGLKQCKGDIIIMMDADLQHSPEIIPQMIMLYKQG